MRIPDGVRTRRYRGTSRQTKQPRPLSDVPTPSSSEPPLLGRAAEFEAIEQALHLVTRGTAQGLAFAGEPGIGKTALLQAACERGAEAGLPVLRGQATEFETEVPFGVFVDALDPTLSHNRRPLSRLGDERLRELAGVFPSLSNGARLAPTGLQAERFRFHSAVRGALEELALQHPLVLALDDLHWADRSSLELLAYLLRHGLSAPLIILFAYRASQAPDLLLHAVASASREGRVTILEPSPLTLQEAAGLIADDMDDQALSALHEECGGNPFCLIELTRAQPIGESKDAGSVPSTISAGIAQELAACSPQSRALLNAAAVVGEPFDLELAGGVAGLDEPTALAALDESGRRNLVRPTDIPAQYAFRHPIVRRAVYETAGRGFTLDAHRRAADLLEQRGVAPAGRAHHVERSAHAGDLEAVALLSAAADAVALRAPATAARWLTSAIRLLGDAQPEQRLERLIPLATALGTSGFVEESRARLEEASGLLTPTDLVMKARVVGAMARLDHMMGRHGAARELLQLALTETGEGPSPGSSALRLELAMDHWYADEWEETVTAARAAAADAEALEDRLSYATAIGLEAVGRSYLGELEPAVALANEAGRIIDQLPDSVLAARIEALVVLSHAEFGGLERASESARHADRGIAISRATGQDSWYGLLMSERCVANLLLGRLSEAGDAADRALDAARVGHYQAQIWALLLRCWVELLAGDLTEAVAHGEEAIAIAERTETGLFNWLAYGCLAMALLEAGQPSRARDMIVEHAGGPDLELVDRAWLPHWYETLTLAELAAGDVDAARRWSDRAQVTAEAFPTPGRLGEACHARAAVELARGRPAAAVTLAVSAIKGFTAADWPIDAARARILTARCLRANSDRDQAIELLQRAHTELDACGAHGYRDEAAQELRASGARVPRDGTMRTETALDPGRLSRRELDVAELVARGMTNRQIGDELFLSPKTVESHMTRILKKTGLSSRAALAAALERWRRAAPKRGAALATLGAATPVQRGSPASYSVRDS